MFVHVPDFYRFSSLTAIFLMAFNLMNSHVVEESLAGTLFLLRPQRYEHGYIAQIALRTSVDLAFSEKVCEF